MSTFIKMKDNFFSGWGEAAGKVNLYVVECDTTQQARQIMKAARSRGEMTQVKELGHCPKDSARVLVTRKHYSDLGGSWHE